MNIATASAWSVYSVNVKLEWKKKLAGKITHFFVNQAFLFISNKPQFSVMQMASLRMVQPAQPPCAAGELAGSLPETLRVSELAAEAEWSVAHMFLKWVVSHISEFSHQGCAMTVLSCSVAEPRCQTKAKRADAQHYYHLNVRHVMQWNPFSHFE